MDLTRPRYDTLMIGLSLPDDDLKERIRVRAHNQIGRGLIEETNTLLTRGVSREQLAELGFEYQSALRCIDGEINDAELATELATKTWQYARRQKTWFKRAERVMWFASQANGRIENAVSTFIRIHSSTS